MIRLRNAAILALLLAPVASTNVRAGSWLLRRGTAEPGTGVATAQESHVVLRPAYPLPRTKPLYLNNYAGSYYPSRRPGSALSPEAFRAMPAQSRLFRPRP